MKFLKKINNFFDFKNTLFLCLWYTGTSVLLNLLAFGLLEHLGSTAGINNNKEVLPNIPFFGKIFMVFFMAVLIPLWEEFVFRFWIGKKYSLLTVLSLGIFLTLIRLAGIDFPILVIVYIIAVIILLALKKKEILQKELDFSKTDTLPYAIALSAVIFGFGHFYYYRDIVTDNPQFLNLSLFLTLVTFGYLGLILTFIRLHFGFKKAFFVHAFMNFLATAPVIFLIDSNIDPYNLEGYQMVLAILVTCTMFVLLPVSTIIGNIKMFRTINLKKYLPQIRTLIMPIILLAVMTAYGIKNDFEKELININRIKNLNQDYKTINNNLGGIFNPSRIAIIDTPVYSEHLALAKNIEKNICLLENCDCAFLESCNHGTAVAGIIAILNPNSKISVFGAINSSGISSKDQITKALAKIVEDKTFYNSVNISVNTSDLFEKGCDDFDQEFTKQAKILKDKGTKIFVSTGNDGVKDKLAYPACSSHVIPVGSINKNGKNSSFSNYQDVKNKEIGEDLEVPAYDFDTKDKFVRVSGTSYASAVMTGKKAN